MLEYNQNSRPKAKKILENPILKRKIFEIFDEEHYGKVLTIKSIDGQVIDNGFEIVNQPLQPNLVLEKMRNSGIDIHIPPDYRDYQYEWVPFQEVLSNETSKLKIPL